MHTALLENKLDFVQLFLENGVSLKDFLTAKELLLLYNEVRMKNSFSDLTLQVYPILEIIIV